MIDLNSKKFKALKKLRNCIFQFWIYYEFISILVCKLNSWINCEICLEGLKILLIEFNIREDYFWLLTSLICVIQLTPYESNKRKN